MSALDVGVADGAASSQPMPSTATRPSRPSSSSSCGALARIRSPRPQRPPQPEAGGAPIRSQGAPRRPPRRQSRRSARTPPCSPRERLPCLPAPPAVSLAYAHPTGWAHKARANGSARFNRTMAAPQPTPPHDGAWSPRQLRDEAWVEHHPCEGPTSSASSGRRELRCFPHADLLTRPASAGNCPWTPA